MSSESSDFSPPRNLEEIECEEEERLNRLIELRLINLALGWVLPDNRGAVDALVARCGRDQVRGSLGKAHADTQNRCKANIHSQKIRRPRVGQVIYLLWGGLGLGLGLNWVRAEVRLKAVRVVG